MRLFLLTAVTMLAFAANSVLNRLALETTAIAPGAFALLRLSAGAAMLLVLVWLKRKPGFRLPWRGALPGAVALALYVLGFSFAYLTLDAGVGALLLFGGVQITMFAGAVIGREAVPPQRWLGAALAFGGLVWLLWPSGAHALDRAGAALMLAAALGWGVYSLIGRAVTAPLDASATRFALAVPLAALVAVLWPGPVDLPGFLLALTSGAVTSGLAYALWYALLPRLGATTAAVAQLTVPVLAMAGGRALLAEPFTLRFVLASLLVLGGVALSLARGPER